MVLKLRLARIATPGGSKRHHPRYNIVLAHARTARDSKPLEVLGTYNPIPETPVGAEPGARKQKDIKLDVDRARYWLGVGAQPSETVWRLLSMINLLPPKYLPTGQQQAHAIRTTRFATHTTPRASSRGKGPVASAIEQQAMRRNAPPAENTSPADPNAV